MPVHTECRVCGSLLPPPFLDLGEMPLANSFLSSEAEFAAEQRYPLAVAGCGTCGLPQLTYVVPAEQLYRDYIYVSSTSDAVRAHADRLAEGIIAQYRLQPSDLVVEVASNDGTVLRAFQQRGVGVLGVEPARNIAALAVAAGIPTIAEFFNGASARQVVETRGRAAVILGRHVFAHVDDLHEFMDAVRTCLTGDGVFIVEVPYVGPLLDHLEFDTVYHEHLSYFSLGAFDHLCRRHGMALADVEPIALHGGSVIVHMRRAGRAEPTQRLTRLLEDERRSGLTSPERLQAFSRRVSEWKGRFEALVAELRRGGATLVGYGAAAKANTLLNFCPDAARSLAYILDRSPHKHHRYTPGTHIRVEPVEHWRQNGAPPTHMVVLAWNFKDEIIRQMQPFADAGGRFVVPIPEPQVL